jgi:hypothetical protein
MLGLRTMEWHGTISTLSFYQFVLMIGEIEKTIRLINAKFFIY